MNPADQACEGKLAVARHAEREPDGRRLDGETADVDRGEDDEEVKVGRPAREVALDDRHERERVFAGRRVGDELLHVARDGDDDREQEDRADDRCADHGPDDGEWRRLAWVLRLFGERARRVEAVDHEQGHEHRGKEDARGIAGAEVARVREDRDRLVVIEEDEDQGKHDHPEDLEDDAGVVHDGNEADAEDAEQCGAQQDERGGVT